METDRLAAPDAAPDHSVFWHSGCEENFRRYGYAVVDLLDASDLAQLRGEHQKVANHFTSGIRSSLMNLPTDLRCSLSRAIMGIIRPRLNSILDNYRFYHSGFVVKAAKDNATELQMHQDFTVCDETRFTSLTVWCPLTQITLNNGALGIVPGSHRLNLNLRAGIEFAYPDLLQSISQNHLRYLCPHPGQAVFLHHRIFHCSGPNRVDQDRVVVYAAGVPNASSLWYCHDCGASNEIEVFEVDSDFYNSCEVGRVPDDGRSLGRFPKTAQSISEQDLIAVTRGHSK